MTEAASNSKSIFHANVSHELRTPMHGILSFADFGRMQYASAPPQRLREFSEEIHDCGLRLIHFLNDLLDLSKLEAGRMTYQMQRNDMRLLVDRIYIELKPLADARGLSFRVDVQGGSDGCFDFDRMGQVVRNLLANAIKFSVGGRASLSKFAVKSES